MVPGRPHGFLEFWDFLVDRMDRKAYSYATCCGFQVSRSEDETMAGKASVYASRRLFYALDQLSKNTLIDLVIDRIRLDVGEDARDEVIARTIRDWLGPVARLRKDRAPDLVGAMERWDRQAEAYRARFGLPAKPTEPATISAVEPSEDELAPLLPADGDDDWEGTEADPLCRTKPPAPGPRRKIVGRKMPRD